MTHINCPNCNARLTVVRAAADPGQNRAGMEPRVMSREAARAIRYWLASERDSLPAGRGSGVDWYSRYTAWAAANGYMLMGRRLFSTRFIAEGAGVDKLTTRGMQRLYSIGTALDDPRTPEQLPTPYPFEEWQLELINEDDLMWTRILSMPGASIDAPAALEWSRANRYQVPVRAADGEPWWTPPAVLPF